MPLLLFLLVSLLIVLIVQVTIAAKVLFSPFVAQASFLQYFFHSLTFPFSPAPLPRKIPQELLTSSCHTFHTSQQSAPKHSLPRFTFTLNTYQHFYHFQNFTVPPFHQEKVTSTLSISHFPHMPPVTLYKHKLQ